MSTHNRQMNLICSRLLRRATLVVALLVFALMSNAAAAAKIGPRLESQMASASPSTQLEVVVSFHGDKPVSADTLNAVNSLGISKGFAFKALPIMGALATPSQIRALANMPSVRSIYPNVQLQYENEGATALTGVDRTRNDSNLTTKNGGLPVSGRGVGVLINDSGIDGLHQDLEFGPHVVENVEAVTNLHAYDTTLPVTYIEGVPNTDLGGGHGTHVAGIVGATGQRSNGRYEGAAPGAALIGYGSGATLLVLDVLGGFDYAVYAQAQHGIRVINNSWGDTGDMNTPFDPDDPINVASKLAFDRNIVVVFSAGNSGPIEATISGNYKKAPWVLCVANVRKDGKLEDSSSRGVSGRKGTVTYPDGATMTWEDRPTVVAPGTDIVSTRASTSSLQALSAPQDAELDPAYAPFYTYMTGTSMAAPHVAGIAALILDANPALTPMQVKQIVQQTATNLPGYETWEVGTGLINAYAAVDMAFAMTRNYGTLLNSNRTFHANALMEITRSNFTIDFNPVAALSPTQNRYYFDVPAGLTAVEAWFYANGVQGQTGNLLNLDIYGPDGKKRASSGIYVLFPLYTDRAVQVLNPEPGRWFIEVTGLKGTASNPTSGVAAPETVQGIVKQSRAGGYSGMTDIAGHPAESAIKLAVNERLIDGFSDKTFRPDQPLTRIQLADYLVMASAVRQYFPTDGSKSFSDVGSKSIAFAEAVAARGSNIRDMFQQTRGVMPAKSPGVFAPNESVQRYAMAYSLVQALGLEREAVARNGQTVTVQVGDQRVPIDDATTIPAGYEGYVSLALDMNLMNAYFSLVQGPYDLTPTIHANFKPAQVVTRAGYAVDITRYYGAWFATP